MAASIASPGGEERRAGPRKQEKSRRGGTPRGIPPRRPTRQRAPRTGRVAPHLVVRRYRAGFPRSEDRCVQASLDISLCRSGRQKQAISPGKGRRRRSSTRSMRSMGSSGHTDRPSGMCSCASASRSTRGDPRCRISSMPGRNAIPSPGNSATPSWPCGRRASHSDPADAGQARVFRHGLRDFGSRPRDTAMRRSIAATRSIPVCPNQGGFGRSPASEDAHDPENRHVPLVLVLFAAFRASGFPSAYDPSGCSAPRDGRAEPMRPPE